jgi:AcrR family transcriptional regulator
MSRHGRTVCFPVVPRLWTDSVQSHRHAVRTAVLDAVGELVAGEGLRAVSMSRVAERSGIGRATLYKYFPDVDAVLAAWHERTVAGHLARLAAVRDQGRDAGARLEAVLTAYAHGLQHSAGHDREIARLLHESPQVTAATANLTSLVRDLVEEAAAAGHVRRDLPADELAAYALHALTAARRLTSPEAVHRLVAVTLAGLRPVG